MSKESSCSRSDLFLTSGVFLKKRGSTASIRIYHPEQQKRPTVAYAIRSLMMVWVQNIPPLNPRWQCITRMDCWWRNVDSSVVRGTLLPSVSIRSSRDDGRGTVNDRRRENTVLDSGRTGISRKTGNPQGMLIFDIELLDFTTPPPPPSPQIVWSLLLTHSKPQRDYTIRSFTKVETQSIPPQIPPLQFTTRDGLLMRNSLIPPSSGERPFFSAQSGHRRMDGRRSTHVQRRQNHFMGSRRA